VSPLDESSIRRSSGCYDYLCNGEDSGVEERWEVTEFGGRRQVESVRHARPVGITLSVESLQEGDQFLHCALRWEQQSPGPELVLYADYQFTDNTLIVKRHWGDEEEQTPAIPVDFVFSPLMRIYNGSVIRQLETRGGECRVCVPWLKDPEQLQQLLLPSYSERKVKHLGTDSISIDGANMACERYDYSGGEYTLGTHFWIDASGVMLAYSWQQDRNAHWEIRLRDYLPAP
jgi:hypothetical protein